ncbi:hypothetical protein Rsub_07064 [Raphidocelis subcapitata]|uniref:Quercetin 2,3-dioxygenase C-terminal cupin domain-containing protein n=1 Tax=Raphidocelis subcapitata TaxID=307507 RepID=A0A2V0P9J8_9CHLO|nr:hypothetical protein Rsub_07064 [Raphidocelis subcapitata]|eukprot:GBF94530.1 hypothetical protein Rsub_07064 [Raphidocelis subcapitata]
MPRVKTARLPGGGTLDWVEWPDDPRHVLAFENAFVRIYSARFDAGQACETMFHRHAEDTLYACITSEGPGGAVLNTEALLDPATQLPVGVGPPQRVSFAPGLCFCHLNRSGPNRIHRIQTEAGNKGTLEFIGAEVLARPPAAATAPLAHPAYRQEPVSHPRARAYRLSLPPGAAGTGPVEWGFSGVAVVLAGAPSAPALAAAAGGALRRGAAFWFDGPLTVDVGNGGGGEAAELLVFEWT